MEKVKTVLTWLVVAPFMILVIAALGVSIAPILVLAGVVGLVEKGIEKMREERRKNDRFLENLKREEGEDVWL